MARINDNYLKLKAGYLFPEIGRRVKAFQQANPSAKIIRMGIGDVTEPLPPAVVQAMHKAVDEMGVRETFRGETVWDGVVEVFDVSGHPVAKQAFAWSHETDVGGRRYVAVLAVPPIDSAIIRVLEAPSAAVTWASDTLERL